MSKTYCVSADAFAYVDADSPEEAEELAELLDPSDWDLQNFNVCSEE
jgi:succinate dehydrogenase flavin-adding protein (antitoxin of CptAB toxin-antitoxin module)